MKNTFISVLGFSVLCAPIWAQEPMALRDAVRMALTGNKSIVAAAASNDAATARVTQARSGFLPKVNYAESWTRSDNPVFVFSSLLTQHQFGEQNFQIGALNRPDFLNNFQSVLSLTRDILNGEKSLNERTQQFAKEH